MSIVTYKSDAEQFEQTLSSLCRAIIHARTEMPELVCTLFIVDNERRAHLNVSQAEDFLLSQPDTFDEVQLRVSTSNVGYGTGHNLVIFERPADFYLVLNPDVVLAQSALLVALEEMHRDGEAVVASPCGFSPAGEPLYLCKRFPLVFDLFLRGFAPIWLRRRFVVRIANYEMHDLLNSRRPVAGIPIVSGCCMLVRGRALRRLGGFDERYFLYFEDFDLSLRLGGQGKNVYLPAMQIVHFGGRASRKGLRHIYHFLRSAFRFYQSYGWRWYRRRPQDGVIQGKNATKDHGYG
ncbi:glycosyltransferase family 2 protein [Gilvimarinus sp. F26214L]|uniref:glycosyltransferase family 2 protein n=1 Tax=Gilvimarinus sp. DZF01 TaxID=3461371 RepID=UPI0040454443